MAIKYDKILGKIRENDTPDLSGYIPTTDYEDFVNAAGDTMSGALMIDGSADTVQLTVQGHSTQANFLMVLENSIGADQFTFGNTGAVVFNEQGNDADFRVESDSNANMLFVDAGANRVGIGTNAPVELFHIDLPSGAAISRIETHTASDVGYRIVNSNRTWLFYQTGSNFVIRDSTGASNRTIWTTAETNFNEAGANIDFRVEGDTDVNLLFADASTDRIGIGESVPDYKLDVNGAIGFTPGATVTPVDNGDVVIEATNNTTLTFKLKGSDGTIRSGTITLS